MIGFCQRKRKKGEVRKKRGSDGSVTYLQAALVAEAFEANKVAVVQSAKEQDLIPELQGALNAVFRGALDGHLFAIVEDAVEHFAEPASAQLVGFAPVVRRLRELLERVPLHSLGRLPWPICPPITRNFSHRTIETLELTYQ